MMTDTTRTPEQAVEQLVEEGWDREDADTAVGQITGLDTSDEPRIDDEDLDVAREQMRASVPAAVEERAAEIAEREGWLVQIHRSGDAERWVEFAAATHGGYCPADPTQTTGPAFGWVEDDVVKGTYGGGQCGGCGQLGSGWVHSGARLLRSARGVDTLADEFRQAVSTARLEFADRTRLRLRRDLAEFLAETSAEEREAAREDRDSRANGGQNAQ